MAHLKTALFFGIVYTCIMQETEEVGFAPILKVTVYALFRNLFINRTSKEACTLYIFLLINETQMNMKCDNLKYEVRGSEKNTLMNFTNKTKPNDQHLKKIIPFDFLE